MIGGMTMKKRIKKQLKIIYRAPESTNREAFLASLEQPRTTFVRFLILQSKYMRKWNFLLAAAIFLFAVWMFKDVNRQNLWSISAAVPFLAMSAATEGGRSLRFGMDELEMAARFSLKTIVTAKIGILGISNLLLLGAALPLAYIKRENVFFYTGLYILIPYLLSAFLNLLVLRRGRREDSFYLCMGITVMLSGIFLVFQALEVSLGILAEHGTWMALAVFFAWSAGREFWKLREQAEEYKWSL